MMLGIHVTMPVRWWPITASCLMQHSKSKQDMLLFESKSKQYTAMILLQCSGES